MPRLKSPGKADRFVQQDHHQKSEQRFRGTANHKQVDLRMNREQRQGQQTGFSSEQTGRHSKQQKTRPDGKARLNRHDPERIGRAARENGSRNQRGIQRKAKSGGLPALQRIDTGIQPVNGNRVIAVVVAPFPVRDAVRQKRLGRHDGNPNRHQQHNPRPGQ